MSIKRPLFHGTFMGYNKQEVVDYLDRLETDFEELEKKKNIWSEKIASMELESIDLKNKLSAKDDETAKMAEENQRLESMIQVLRAKVDSQDAIIARMKADYTNLEKDYEESESNPKRIQEAILSAQDMGKQIVDKATKDADGIRVKAEADRISREEEGRMTLAAAKLEADKTLSEAKNEADKTLSEARTEADNAISEAKSKCAKLQNDYNQMLMDASGFKAELMNLYRRHMELLTAFPEREVIAVDAVQIEDEED